MREGDKSLLLNFSFEELSKAEQKKFSEIYSGVASSQSLENEVARPDEFNKVVESLRDDYTHWVGQQNNRFLKVGASDKTLSLFFLTDFSVKRTEIFPTVSSIAHCIILKEKLARLSYSKIYLKGGRTPQVDTLWSYLKKEFPSIEFEKIDSRDQYKKIYPFLSNLKFFTMSLIKLMSIKLLGGSRKPALRRSRRAFLTRYPLHFDKNWNEDKYASFLNEKDLVFVDVLTDGMHQNLSYRKYIQACKEVNYVADKRNLVLIDSYFTFGGFLKSFFFFLKVMVLLPKLTKEKYFFQEIDISKLVYEEIKFSFLRLPRLKFLFYRMLKCFQEYSFNEFIYYLHEYPYGRMVSYLLGKHFKGVQKVGFQHGPASLRKYLYYLSKEEVNSKGSLYSVPLPDLVLAEDSFSKEVYSLGNYPRVDIMLENYRLHYLKKIRRDNVQKNTELVACGLHDGLFILRSIRKRIIENPNIVYYFKTHPRANNKILHEEIFKLNAGNIIICDKTIDYYLEFIERVIVTYSSVGPEALSLGIPVTLLRIPGVIDESPIRDIGSFL